MNFLPVTVWMTMTQKLYHSSTVTDQRLPHLGGLGYGFLAHRNRVHNTKFVGKLFLNFGLNHQCESIISRVTVGLTSQSVRWLWRAQRWGSPIPSVGSAWNNTGYRGPQAPSALWCWSSGGLESHCWGSWCSVAGGGAWPGTPNHLEDIFIHECMDFTNIMW